MGRCKNGYKYIGLQALFRFLFGLGHHDFHNIFRIFGWLRYGSVEDSIKLMGALNDTCLRLVLSLSEFAPEAGRKIKEIEKQIKRRSLTCRLFLQMTFLSSRLCLQHCHIFPSNFESTPCLACHILPRVLTADFFCNL